MGLPPWLDLEVERPARATTVLVAMGVGVVVAVAVRAGGSGLAGALAVVAASLGLLRSGVVSNPDARALAAAAPLFGGWLALRASPWLLFADVLAATGLLALAASLARGGRASDLRAGNLAARLGLAAVHLVAAPGFLTRPLRARVQHQGAAPARARLAAAGRGVLLALPLVAVFAALLASADAVFAAAFRIRVAPGPSLGHLALTAIGTWAMAGLLRAASARPASGPQPAAWRLGGVEAVVVLASLVAVFAAFVVAQAVAVSDGGRRVIETAGLTYAEYARSGFFQLLAVAALTLVVIAGIRAVTDPGGPVSGWIVGFAQAAVALNLVIVIVAVRRLLLYEAAFGLTMLRLMSIVFAVWVGAVFVFLAADLAGVERSRHWLVPAALGTGLALLLVLNIANPEAIVVKRNLARAERVADLDVGYLAGLSDDAVPAVVLGAARLPAPLADELLTRLCQPPSRGHHGWAAANLARVRAEAHLADACPRSRHP